MTTIIRALTALMLTALIAACGPGEPIAESGDAQAGTAAPTVQETTAPDEPSGDVVIGEAGETTLDEPSEPASEDEGGGPTADFEVAISGAKWNTEGVRVRVTYLGLADLESFCGGLSELDRPFLCDEHDGGTIVALEMDVRNKSNRDVDVFADQAQLVLGSEQIDSEMIGPDDVGGTIRAGAEKDGQVWWISEQSVDELRELGEMRMIIPGPSWTDDYEPVTGDYDDIDLTVTW